jgi:hypothetical protein
MNTDFEKLGSRVVATKHWRWMPGMAVMQRDGDDIVDKDSGLSFAISEVRVTSAAFEVCEPQHHFVDVSTLLNGKTRSVGSMFTKGLLPDFSDPATLGCLLYLVREVGKTRDVSAIRSEFKDGSVVWSVPVETRLALEMGLEDGFVRGATEAECLVAVLESLP